MPGPRSTGRPPTGPTSSNRSPTSSPPAPHDTAVAHQPPPGPPLALRGAAPDRGAGGARAADRHGGGDRRALRGQPRHVRDRGGDPLADRLAARQGAVGRRPPGLSAQDPDGAP